MIRRLTLGVLATIGAIALACSSDSVTGARPGQGMLAIKLTDAPTPIDSIKEVNVFVERIDARRARTDSSLSDMDIDEQHHEHESNHDSIRGGEGENEGVHSDSALWVTIATPNATFNLLNLQNGVTAFLGASPVDTGSFRAVRLVIDPARSTIVLKDGTILSATSVPPVEFEKSRHHGLMVELNETMDVNEGQTTTFVLDFKLDASLTLRGRTVHDGFFFRPVIVGAREHQR